MAAKILIVDDEHGIRESLGAALRDEGYEVETVATGEDCLAVTGERQFDLVMLDVWLPQMDGLTTLEQLQQRDATPIVVMISGHGNIETAVRSTKLGAFDFVEKPLSLEKISLVVRNALEYVRLEEENKRLRAELEHKHQVQGNSVLMKALRQQIALTGPTNGRVLIYGESGTGKELVARALHASSARSLAPFVEVNCAAIPEELIESELFGHRKGSFAGAAEDKIGKFQKADGGTLFLDEVGDMSLKTQSKVLRVLEEQRVEPLGSSSPVKVDVRVIAATNKKLEDEIARNAFREDLFYRLNVIPFYVPALRERTEDVPILAAHFLAEFASEYGKKPKEFSQGAMEVLKSYPWPGNVRELKNLVERLVIVCPSPFIETHHLPPEVFRGAPKSPQKPYESLQEARSAYEREFVLRKLEENRWNMTKAAQALGLERSHLYRKMRSLGIASGKAAEAEAKEV
ncbi:MAG TPA: sigma-54 dependent transcriptional regulator [Candidatus Acidoferrum sp.]|nr:sigma-54 dependent transcriptional regulator [Candidatus Acidoferrum sp.]